MAQNQILTGKARFLAPGEMVLDPGPRNPVNINTTAAVGTVQANERAFVGQALAGARMGDAIADVGGALGQLALKQMEAVNITRVAEAQDVMSQAEYEMKTAMAQEADELKWTEIAKSHATKAKERIDKIQLSPAAKTAVESEFSRWQLHRTGQTGLESAKQSFAKAQKRVETSLALAVQKRDKVAFEANLKGAGDIGLMTDEAKDYARVKAEEEWKRMDKQAEAEAFDQGLNSAVAVAAGSGEEVALQDLEKGVLGTFDASQKERIRSAIQAVSRDRAAADIADITEKIVTGTIKDPAAIDALASRHLTPALRKHAKGLMANFDADKARQDRDQNGVRNAVELRKRVKEYDPSADPDRTKYFSLVKEIGSRVEQSQAGEITGELYRKYGTNPPKMEVRPEIQQNVSKSLDVMFDGMTGAIPWKKEVTDPVGRKSVQIDTEAQRRALDAQTVVEMKMNDWFRDNPDKAQNLNETQKKLNELLPEGTRAAALGTLQKLMSQPTPSPEPPNLGAEGAIGPDGADWVPAPARSRVTSYAYQNDETPDTNSSFGIGAFVPDAEQEKIKRGEDSPYKLKENDFAVSRDVEKTLRAAGIRPGDTVTVQMADGTTQAGRWMDRTAETWEGKAVTGRWDFYRAGKKTKHEKEAMKVTGFRRD